MSKLRRNIKMTSSTVSSLLLFLVLLLVFPHINKALGTQMEFRKLKETYHPHHVTVQKRYSVPRIPRDYRSPRVPGSFCPSCKRHFLDDPSPPAERYVPRRPITRPKSPGKLLPRRPITVPYCVKFFPACTPQAIDRTPPPPPPPIAFAGTYGLGH